MFSHFIRKLQTLAGWFAPTGRSYVESGGMYWQIEASAAGVMGTAGPDLATWESSGSCEVIKQNLQRTIRRVRLPGGIVYVKECRANTPRSWAREVLRPAKARLEFENALVLQRLGVPVIEPLAWGDAARRWPGTSYLVTRGQEGAVPFQEFLTTTLPHLPAELGRAIRRQLAHGFARYLARMHDAGVAHPDPHTGNFLIELPPSRMPHFYLTDLHAVRFGKPLTWPETKANLTLLNRWFQLRVPGTDRLRFWIAYLSARHTLSVGTRAEAGQMARELERATTESNLRFWAARTGGDLTDNRDSRHVRAPGMRGCVVRDLPEALVRSWLADPDSLFTGAYVLKDSRTSTVVERRIETPSGEREIVCKRFNLRSRIDVAKNLLRSSPALRSWVLGNNLRDRDLPTARPLAMLHRTRLGVPLTGYVVFEKVPAALTLPEAVAALHRLAPSRSVSVRRAWCWKIGKLIRRMHEREVSHRDLKAPNVLMAGAAMNLEAAEPVLIDLVGVEVGRPVPVPTRVRDLARLNASFLGSSDVSATDRLRVLKAYLGRGEWKSWWNEIDSVTRSKVARNERLGRPLG